MLDTARRPRFNSFDEALAAVSHKVTFEVDGREFTRAIPEADRLTQTRLFLLEQDDADRAAGEEPGIHPIAAEIRDIILSKAASGEPTLETDLEHLTLADIKAHFPAARLAAHAQIVRQVGDDPRYETREEMLTRAIKLLIGRLPTAAEMHGTLRAHGITNKEIADLWPELMAATGQSMPAARKLPQLQVVS